MCTYSVCHFWLRISSGIKPWSTDLNSEAVVTGRCPGWVGTAVSTQPGQRPVTTCAYKSEAASTVWISWWWAVCRSKHVEPSIHFGIIILLQGCILFVISTDSFLSYLFTVLQKLITPEPLRIGPRCTRIWRFWLRISSGIKSRNTDLNSWDTLYTLETWFVSGT